MATPDVHAPDGANAGAALGSDESKIEDATVKSIEDKSEPRANPSDGAQPAWMGVVEDLLRVGGKELFEVTKDYVREGNLNLFTRRNPEPDPEEGEEGDPNAPRIPSGDYFNPEPRGGASSKANEGGTSSSNRKAPSSGGGSASEDYDGPTPNPAPMKGDVSPGDLARVEVGNSVVWVEVTGTADGTDDYEGRLAAPALGLPEDAPVTFAKRHLLGRVGEAPENPTPGTPEGIAGKRTRDNPAGQDGPLPPRF